MDTVKAESYRIEKRAVAHISVLSVDGLSRSKILFAGQAAKMTSFQGKERPEEPLLNDNSRA